MHVCVHTCVCVCVYSENVYIIIANYTREHEEKLSWKEHNYWSKSMRSRIFIWNFKMKMILLNEKKAKSYFKLNYFNILLYFPFVIAKLYFNISDKWLETLSMTKSTIILFTCSPWINILTVNRLWALVLNTWL